jgi:hypothetical protein
MMRSAVRGLAIMFWLLAVLMLGALVVASLFRPEIKLQNNDPAIGAAMLGMTTVGALVAMRKPQQPLGWLLLVIGFSAMLAGFSQGYADWAAGLGSTLVPGFTLMAWLAQWTWILALGLLLSFFLLLYPTGHLPTGRWRLVAWLEGFWLGAFVIFMAFSPGDSSTPNPLGLSALEDFPFTPIFQVGAPLVTLVSTTAMVVRYRRDASGERQQIKWLLYPVALLIAAAALEAVAPAFGLSQSLSYVKLIDLSFSFIYLLFPIVIAVAILRYRLFDINVIIRKTLVYTVVTGLLALIYFGSIVLLQAVFEALSGQQTPFSIVISTLLIAALFTPLRRRVQEFIDRRFYRRKYNAERALATFAIIARDEMGMEPLAGALWQLVDAALQPEQMSIWLVKREPLGRNES